MSKFAKRLRALWNRQALDRDLEDEMAFHLAMSEQHGADPASARRRLGNTAALKEACRELWAFGALEAWWQDCRFALRTLKNGPLVTLTAVLALGLGIGANATVFTVVNSALSFDMGVDRIERVVAIHPGEGLASLNPAPRTPIDFLNLRGQVKSVQSLAAYRFSAVNVSDSRGLPERYWRVQMTPSGWDMVKPKPILGRGFGPSDELAGATPVVMLSHRVWEKRYGRDPGVVGAPVRIDDVPHTVIGVMPAGAQFPEDTDVWTPLTVKDLLSARADLLVFGRLADGATLAAAQSEVDGVARRAIAAKLNGPAVHVRPFLEMIGIYDGRAMLIAMVFAVGFVLLIVCGDVANLLLARAAARTREISIRIAIGAGRARIVRQLLVESLVLAVVGGLAGWLVTLAGLRWFDSFSAQSHRPSWLHFSMDAHSFAYLAAISLGAGILFGLAPALQLAKVDVNQSIKDGGRGAEGGVGGGRMAGVLVIFQMALCVVLLAASGLMIHSTVNLYNAPLAVEASNVLTMHVDLPETKYATADTAAAFYRRLKATLGEMAGVSSVALSSHLPTAGWRELRGEVEGSKSPTTARFNALVVDENYFDTLAVRIRRGQAFHAGDGGEGTQAIVNESFAAKFWKGEDPIGKRLRRVTEHGAQPWMTVVGVTTDVQQNRMSPLEHNPLIYLPYDAEPQHSAYVIARTTVPPASLVAGFRRAVQGLDENLPAQDVLALDDFISRQRLNTTAFGNLFSIFAAIALVLAWVGLYAVVAHAVSRRTQEIGIRMAMGGTRANIFGLVVKQGMRQVMTGFIVGLPLAILVTRVLSRGLVGVSPTDPATYVGVALVLGFAGLLGCAIPARRAVRVDPLAALRHE